MHNKQNIKITNKVLFFDTLPEEQSKRLLTVVLQHWTLHAVVLFVQRPAPQLCPLCATAI